jgi:hypothetical protein
VLRQILQTQQQIAQQLVSEHPYAPEWLN